MATSHPSAQAEDSPALCAVEPPLVEIDLDAYAVLVSGTPVLLSAKEFDLLVALARRPRALVRNETLLREVWHYQALGRTRTVNAHACRLRKRLGLGQRLVRNVHGRGYCLLATEDPGRVCLGERSSLADLERPAEGLAPVAGLAPGTPTCRIWLAGTGRDPVVVLGSREEVVSQLTFGGRALVELESASGEPVAIGVAQVALVEAA